MLRLSRRRFPKVSGISSAVIRRQRKNQRIWKKTYRMHQKIPLRKRQRMFRKVKKHRNKKLLPQKNQQNLRKRILRTQRKKFRNLKMEKNCCHPVSKICPEELQKRLPWN